MFLNKFRNGYLPWGGRNPLQLLKKKLILKKITESDAGGAEGDERK
jgi:hypothetical protein